MRGKDALTSRGAINGIEDSIVFSYYGGRWKVGKSSSTGIIPVCDVGFSNQGRDRQIE